MIKLKKIILIFNLIFFYSLSTNSHILAQEENINFERLKNGNLIFPNIPVAITELRDVLIEQLEEMKGEDNEDLDDEEIIIEALRRKNFVFIGSEFIFEIPKGSNTYTELDGKDLSKSGLTVELKDSKGNIFSLTTEVKNPYKDTADSFIVKASKVPEEASSGKAQITLIVNSVPLEQDKIFISQTLANLENLPEEKQTSINSVVLVRTVKKLQHINNLKLYITGTNIYGNRLRKSKHRFLTNKNGFMDAEIAPFKIFKKNKTKALKRKRILISDFQLENSRITGETFISISTPYGIIIKPVTILECDSGQCGDFIKPRKKN